VNPRVLSTAVAARLQVKLVLVLMVYIDVTTAITITTTSTYASSHAPDAGPVGPALPEWAVAARLEVRLLFSESCKLKTPRLIVGGEQSGAKRSGIGVGG